jgi:DNA invertase Pin-like site-specific DNA recombinase
MARPVRVSTAKLAPAYHHPLVVAGVPIQCVVYAAKSTEDKRGSIPDQVRECRAAIEHDADRRIVGEYTDEAFSAFTGNRGPGLLEAMERVEDLASKRGGVELWAQHSDRLARGDGRSARHAVEIALWALKRDVRVRTVQDPDTFRDLLYAVVTGQRNHEDSRRKGLAVAAGRRRAAVRGDYLGYKPDGYRLAVEVDKRGQVAKRLVIDPERQPAIELIFRMARRGNGTGAIARALNDAGWVTKPLFRNKTPRPWTGERVRVVLRNRRYAGLSVVKGEVVASGHWPAYVTPRQYAGLQARWAQRAPMKLPRQSEAYLLSRLASCGSCGGALYARTQQQRNDGTLDRRYACAGHTQGRHAGRCLAPQMSANVIEAMFVASLASLMHDGPEVTGLPEPSVSAAERQQVVAAVLSDDQERIDATLADLIERRAPELALLRRKAASRNGGPDSDALRAFATWAQEEQIGRTDATRKETRALNRVLRTWFASVAITMEEMSVTIETLRRSPAGEPVPQSRAAVRFDLQTWMRLSPQAAWLRRPYGPWSDPEILGSLQAWADTQGGSPTEKDWATAAPEHPCSKTVLAHFKTWERALKKAGLKSAVLPPARDHG